MSTADKLNKVLETKEAIKQAIIDKGGTVGDVFAEYPTAIQNIQGGGGSGTFVVPAEMRFGQSKFTEFPEDWDWSEIEKVTKPNNLFYYCEQLKEVPKLKFKDLQSGANMFNYCSKVTDIDTSEWNTSNLTDTQYMFYKTNVTTNPPLNTSKVTTMQNMFANCTNLTEIKDLDTSSATRIDSMFNSCSKLQTVSELDCSKLTSDNSSYSSPFNNCYLLRYFGGFKGLKVNMYLDKCYSLSYESLMNVINKLADGVSGKTLYLFQDLVNQLSDDDIAIATSKGWSISPARTITEPVVVTNLNQIPSTTYQITPRTYDFSQYSGSARIPCFSYIRYFEGDFLNSTNIAGMFTGATSLKSAILTNTSNITDMNRLFMECRDMEHLYIADTSNVTSMVYMFNDCSNLKDVNVSEWDVGKVTDMQFMFSSCDSLVNLDLSGWNASNVKNMQTMFAACQQLESVNFGKCDLSSVESTYFMFSGCTSLKSVTMLGPINNEIITLGGMFNNITTTGTFYYNPAYDYSKIIAQLPATWTAVPLTE